MHVEAPEFKLGTSRMRVGRVSPVEYANCDCVGVPLLLVRTNATTSSVSSPGGAHCLEA
jgi:hypothetical protein